MGATVGRRGHETTSNSTTASNGNEKEALKSIWYPISYKAVILPISIARWSSSFMDPESNTPVRQLPITKTAVTTSAIPVGLVNVLVFMLTRPHLLLFDSRHGTAGDPPGRLTSNFGAPPRPAVASAAIDPSQSSEWLPKSSGLTGCEPPRYIASLPSSPNPAAKLGNAT
ncbi:hypothetical protein FRB90_000528 [Tulasnella sp. 427]|nr:hypothetical protein FRB90_000528 [Tulasnella sp. 427]